MPRQAVPATRFAVTELEGSRVLKMEAAGSYGTLLHTVGDDAASARTLSWRWRVDRLAEGVDLRTKRGDDAAAKVCVMFELPMEQVPFMERQALRVARVATSQEIPAATLCYVWDATLPPGTVLPNAFTRRMRWFVLQGAGVTLGRWQTERRDLRADFLRAFGDEAKAAPPIADVLVGADADNTQGRSLAYVADLELVR